MPASSHKSDYVNVNGIRLHYLDWGGNGPVLLFLAGMGCNAYIFDRFAPRFIDKFHVLALTRRGHGDSDHPETGYDADALTEDLRQFMNKLEIDKAILAGHSLAYIELCHFTALYPERVLKLVFLDAAYDYLSSDYMTEEQKAQVIDYFNTTLRSFAKKNIEQFQRNVPHVRIVETPHGHHYCFIKHEELVFGEKFSLER